MNDPRTDPTENRKPWPWPVRLLVWLYRFLLGPFLTKHPDGTITGAMTRWAVAAFTAAMVYRLVTILEPLNGPEAFVIFVTLYALGIDDGIKGLARKDPGRLVEAVTGMYGRAKDVARSAFGGSSFDWSQGSVTRGGTSPGYERPADLTLDSDPAFTEGDEP